MKDICLRMSEFCHYRHVHGLNSANGCDVTKRAIIDVKYIVSGRNYGILAPIIAQMLTSRPCRLMEAVLDQILTNQSCSEPLPEAAL